VYKVVFSIEHGGRPDITQHIEKKKHLLVLSSASKNENIISYLTKQGPSGLKIEGLKISAEGGMFTFYIIVNIYSFRSMYCTRTLIRKLHEK
jgi:hypothetical protein